MNRGAVFGAVLLISLCLTGFGSLYLLKTGTEASLELLKAQVKMKVAVSQEEEVALLAAALRQNSQIASVKIEEKKQTLERLKSFFRNREHLFMMLEDRSIPTYLVIEAKEPANLNSLAEELNKLEQVDEVIYPREFARNVLSWSKIIEQYGLAFLLIIGVISCISVWMAVNLALNQRQQEIRVKLLLGARPLLVQLQFIVEGAIIGFIAGLCAMLPIYLIDQVFLNKVESAFPTVVQFPLGRTLETFVILIVGGLLIGLAGSYLSVRKLMRNV